MILEFKEERLLAVSNGPRNFSTKIVNAGEHIDVIILEYFKNDVTIEFEDGSRADVVPKEWFMVID